jgi:DsbC/DsbD-like thiol-disulfide interchange protein
MTRAGALRLIAAVLVWSFAAAAPSQWAFGEENASPWLELPNSRARLIAADGLPYDGRSILAAGLEIALEKGWKTYWRTPGDGLAPLFDWSGSEGLDEADILWPVPKRFEGPGGVIAFGYEDRLVLPIRLVPSARCRPVQFRLRVSYAVCADICVPIEAELALEITPGVEGPHRNTMLAALGRVPREQARGIYCPHSFVTAKRRTMNGRPAIVIKTAFGEGITGLDLFAEAPEAFNLPPPLRQPRATRGRLYHILGFETDDELDALQGRELTLTMAANQGSCETTWRVE